MKTVVITGGTGGLGPTVVRHLAKRYRCALLYRRRSTFDEVATSIEGEVHGFEADLGDADSVRRALDEITSRFGAPYALVHLAGGYAGGAVADTPLEEWERMIALNLTGAFIAAKETLRSMDRTAPGRIVAISSAAALSKGPGMAAYVVSKSALATLIEVLARELRESSITANALLPGSMATDAMVSSGAGDLVPLERVAATIDFLLSDEGGSINGALIPLEAGA